MIKATRLSDGADSKLTKTIPRCKLACFRPARQLDCLKAFAVLLSKMHDGDSSEFFFLINNMNNGLSPKRTLLCILVPMMATFICQRLYLHLVRVQHIHAGGYLIHHLFSGALLVIAAAFVLAFGTRNRWLAHLTPAALGIGSAMVLDEVTYLVATQASDADYVSALSFWGALVLVSLAVAFLFVLYKVHSCREPKHLPRE
jgi:hypothetical protein